MPSDVKHHAQPGRTTTSLKKKIKYAKNCQRLILLHEMHDVILNMVTGMICMLQCINRSRGTI